MDKSNNWKIGDKVIVKGEHGNADYHGVIEKIWVNQYGVEMASVNFAPHIKKTDWMMSWHRHASTNSLKAWE